MMNLFVSFQYTARYGDQYDSGFANMIIEDSEEPVDQDDLEQLTTQVTELYTEYNKLDSVSLTIIYFKEV